MKTAIALIVAGLLPGAASASTSFLSFTGALSSPEDVFEVTFSLSATADIEIDTWGFGGGTNAAGALILAGGFDPMISLFSGPRATATIYTIAGISAADADTLFNPPFSFVGNCPPAGMVTIGTGSGSSVCGDDLMQIPGLAAAVYTLVLSDANYIPNAVNPGPPTFSNLSDGFSDLTGGVFQTCNFTSDQPAGVCMTPNANYAVDIVDQSGAALTDSPEPRTLVLLIAGLTTLAFLKFHPRKGESK